MTPAVDARVQDGARPMFGARAHDAEGVSLPVKLIYKATRFLARSARRKTAVLCNGMPMVSFTFDDVPSSACRNGAPILERHGARGTFYVAGGGCGKASPVGRLASVDEIRQLQASGHEIACHTFSHPEIPRISLAEIDAELARNRTFLRDIDANIVPANFAYPYGEMSMRTKRFLEGRFDSCRSVHPGINSGSVDLGSLKAWPLESIAVDGAKIERLIAETVQSYGWLIFYSHDVTDNPTKYGVTPDLLDCAVATAKKAGCVIATVAGALAIGRVTTQAADATGAA